MTYAVPGDASPLTPAQMRALAAATARELWWGLPGVAHELRRWRKRAESIPDSVIRTDALDALDRKRTNTDGAALFWTLADRRNHDLLRLLAVYQAIWDLLDSLTERHPTEANGRRLHLALVDALDPARTGGSSYYEHHPWEDDGGYLAALVESCRARCRLLPSYTRVQPFVMREAYRAQVQALNHLPDRGRRDRALRCWATSEFRIDTEVEWFELTAAASASLVILPLLALAAKPDTSEENIVATRAVYWPWVSLATTMLDNYADQAEDVASGNHNYFTHYEDAEVGVKRLGDHIARGVRAARALPDGERHALVVCSMVAMYLSKDPKGTLPAQRRQLARAGGSLVRLLIPVLRAWRIAYSQRSH